MVCPCRPLCCWLVSKIITTWFDGLLEMLLVKKNNMRGKTHTSNFNIYSMFVPFKIRISLLLAYFFSVGFGNVVVRLLLTMTTELLQWELFGFPPTVPGNRRIGKSIFCESQEECTEYRGRERHYVRRNQKNKLWWMYVTSKRQQITALCRTFAKCMTAFSCMLDKKKDRWG